MAVRSGKPPPLQAYGNRSGNSGVVAYALAADAVHVVFANDDKRYVYGLDLADAARLDEMQRLALAGRGLSGFISRQFRQPFAGRTVPLTASERTRWGVD
jgi:hypothetical protein